MAGTTQPDEIVGERFVRLAPVARQLDVAPSTIVSAILRGQLRGLKVGKHWRVSEQSIREMLERGSG